ncbi:hypothetical protein TURU_091436 [Turdus rufiventris]|nr:hypothetical protein TURU_091436 [Turdus rufiventris]
MEAEEIMECIQEFPEHYKVILDRLNEQREQDQFTDITLIVDGHHFKAHKAVLAACSQFFYKFFQDFTQEPLVEIEGAAYNSEITVLSMMLYGLEYSFGQLESPVLAVSYQLLTHSQPTHCQSREEKLQDDLIGAFQYLKGVYGKDGERLFTKVWSDKTRRNGFTLTDSVSNMAFRHLIEFTYTAKLMVQGEEEANDVWKAAEYLQMLEAIKALEIRGLQKLTLLEAKVSLTGKEWKKHPIVTSPEAPCILGIDFLQSGYFKDPKGLRWTFGIAAVEAEVIKQLKTLPGLSENLSAVGLLKGKKQNKENSSPLESNQTQGENKAKKRKIAETSNVITETLPSAESEPVEIEVEISEGTIEVEDDSTETLKVASAEQSIKYIHTTGTSDESALALLADITSKYRQGETKCHIQEEGGSATDPSCKQVEDIEIVELQLSHVKNLFHCEKCNRSFKLFYHFKEHMKTHSAESYKCDICNKSYLRESALKQHLTCHHLDEGGASKKQRPGKKIHICQYCEKQFDHFGHFKEHLRKHTAYISELMSYGMEYPFGKFGSAGLVIHLSYTNFGSLIYLFIVLMLLSGMTSGHMHIYIMYFQSHVFVQQCPATMQQLR